MREIKFKIYYQHENTGRITDRIIELGQPIAYLGLGWMVIAKRQFTGKQDSQGTDIYEGDIVADEDGNTAEIRWQKQYAQFYADFEDCQDLDGIAKWATVISNIYEDTVIGKIYEDKAR